MKLVLLLLLFNAVLVQSAMLCAKTSKSSVAFWRDNPKLLKKVHENRDILVSVKSTMAPKISPKAKHLDMQGVGLVNSPTETAFKLAKDFSNLPKVSSFIKKVKYDAVSHKLYMHSVAFDYHAKMWMLVGFVEDKSKKSITFKVVKGVFSGMTGEISFKELPKNKSQIELLAAYNYIDLAIPSFFIEFGLEVIIQKVAVKMRSFIEGYRSESKSERTKKH